MTLPVAWVALWCGFGAAAESVRASEARVYDLKHTSEVFGEDRSLRVFLPPDYGAEPGKRYPVIYFFHGYSQRYNQPGQAAYAYDTGADAGGNNLAAFAARHDVILVKWDGYNPRSPGEEYPRPYNIGPVETYRQFPLYFPELVAYVDSKFRTLADRDHRGVSGFSMGGFMAYWVAGKYPHLVSSASAFMPSTEFFVGPKAFPAEYRHEDMYRNYEGVRTRLIIGERDFIRWYHRRLAGLWTFVRPGFAVATYDSPHGVPELSETLRFHMRCFRELEPAPEQWHHIDVYPEFDVWGFSVWSGREQPGFTMLETVSRAGFRLSVREWLPEGSTMPRVPVRVTTAPYYAPGSVQRYTVMNLETGEVLEGRARATPEGRLSFRLTGARHEVGIGGEEPEPVLGLAGWKIEGAPWLTAGKAAALRLEVLNKGTGPARGVAVSVGSPNRGVVIEGGDLEADTLAPGERRRLTGTFEIYAGNPDQEIAALVATLRDAEGRVWRVPFEVAVFPDAALLEDYALLDGMEVPVWRHAVEPALATIGAGNADGKANPGETIAIGVLDGDAFRTAELYTTDPCVDALGTKLRVSDTWRNYDHVGATVKTSLPVIAAGCEEGHEIPFFARYVLPDKPEHVLKQGVVRLKVTGKDRTPPEVRRVAFSGRRLEVELADGALIAQAEAHLTRETARFRVTLADDGAGADRAARDSIFSGYLPPVPAGTYRLKVEAMDEFGNRAESDQGEIFTQPESQPE